MSASPEEANDPFALLNLPRRFHLRRDEIDNAHLRASMVWHPDRFALRPDHERLAAEDKMAAINEAYAILRDHLNRAVALLECEGISITEGTDTTSSPDFLMAMMELKEEAAMALAENNDAEIADLDAKLAKLEIAEVKSAERELDSIPRSPQSRHELLEKARGYLQRAAYFRKTREDLNRTHN